MKNQQEPPSDRVTLVDIAKALGISHTTVSLALKKHPRISEATRTRVEEKAREMGYQPDPLFAALAQYRQNNRKRPISGTLAWIHAARDPAEFKQFKEFQLYFEGAAEAAAKLGYQLEEFAVARTPLRRLNTIFRARNIRGILLSPPYEPSYDWKSFPWDNYATVKLSRSILYPQSHLVSAAQIGNTMLAFEKAREMGYQRIGFACEYICTRFFALGYSWAQKSLPPERQLPILTLSDADTPANQRALLKRWILKEKPDAIYIDSEKVTDIMEQLKGQIPDHIGLIVSTINDLSTADAGIDQNAKEIGRMATRSLVSMLNEQRYGIPDIRTETLVDGTWIDGSSLPPKHILTNRE